MPEKLKKFVATNKKSKKWMMKVDDFGEAAEFCCKSIHAPLMTPSQESESLEEICHREVSTSPMHFRSATDRMAPQSCG
jgi:hypothetical protein